MSRFPSTFLEEIKTRLRTSDVIGRHVSLKKAGREWRGLSPFNKERTPSFFVNDEKQAFFDFSSGRSGDIFKFLMLTQNRTFPEAVEELASLAGLEVPKESPAEERRASEQEKLLAILADAQGFFRQALESDEGHEARDYLRRRGVRQSSADAFGLGYAPPGWETLKRHFLGRGVGEDLLLRAGLLKKREEDGTTYDGFRHRVMFPIRDPRGRVIAFGGRALSAQAKAKYLNSPETEVFHKGRVLYNFGRARQRMKGETPLLICEGYMDALALDAAGFAAVAPLGTAVTEDQLRLLWRITPVPVLCFDGDRAGRAAAERALERALPHLSARQSLRFVFLPEGEDPDDLLRRGGAPAMQELLDARTDAEETMWRLACARHGTDSAEHLAALESELKERANQVQEPTFKGALGRAFKDRLYALRGELFAARRKKERVQRQRKGPATPQLSDALRKRLGQGGLGGPNPAAREAQLVVSLIHHPEIFARYEDEILGLELIDPDLSKLLTRTIDLLVGSPDLDSDALRSQLSGWSEASSTYKRWSEDPLLRIVRFTRQDADAETARSGWYDAYLIDRRQKILAAEVNEAGAEAHIDPGRERVWLDSVRLSLGAHTGAEQSEDGEDD